MMGYGVGMGIGWIFMVLFWAALVALIVWAVTRLVPGPGHNHQQPTTTSRETPMDILDRRLASGEITPEEYSTIRATLTSSPKQDG